MSFHCFAIVLGFTRCGLENVARLCIDMLVSRKWANFAKAPLFNHGSKHWSVSLDVFFLFFFSNTTFFCWGTQTECVTYMLLQNKSPPWTNTFNSQLWRTVIGAQLSPFAPASICLIALCTLSLSKPHTCGFVCPLMCAHVSAGVLSIRPHCWGSSFEDGKHQT